jgi:formimidoylglutamate deiminase
MPDSSKETAQTNAWLPDLLYMGNGRFESGVALVCDARGNITSTTPEADLTGPFVRLRNRALLPGLVNAHSHAFQRVIRGRTERRTGAHDSFWTWREMMYSAAQRLDAEEIYAASRMAFLEMALGGVTSVGEFHYIHRAPDGSSYGDANLMAKAVVRAARDVGLRIALLRVAYARAGFQTEPNPRQVRFLETNAEDYLRNAELLKTELAQMEGATAWVGLAPHSVRAVPLHYLREIARYAESDADMPVHMHVAEQPAETSACLAEHGRTPVAFLDHENLLTPNFTGVHAIHITQEEARKLARARAIVCACPTTERNLGDGIVPAEMLLAEGVSVALGTDSHAQIDLLEDARELEYHLRLQKLGRALLAPAGDDSPSALARALFDCATINGARSLNAPGGTLDVGRAADFFTVALDDSSIAGAAPDDLLSCIVFGLARTALREVFVGGKQLVSEGQHQMQPEIVEKFTALQRKLWS